MKGNAIIIGISGQDGSYLAKLLLEKGYQVFGITRDSLEFRDKNLRYLGIENNVHIVELESLNIEKIKKILRWVKPVEVYNLSAQSSVGESFKDPFTTIQYNILSVLNWLECIKEINRDIKFYHASSSEMFGNVPFADLPLKESLIFRPASPYGVSKAGAHWLVVNHRESNSLFSSCGILFNHESPLRGSNYVVKKIINTCVRVKLGLTTEKLKLGNLKIKRDWGYAPDYVYAMWLIMQYSEPADFMICSGNLWSLESLLNYVLNKLSLDGERHVEVDQSLMRPTDLGIIYGDNSKAKQLLGWKYDMSNEQLIDRLIEDEMGFIEWDLSNSSIVN